MRVRYDNCSTYQMTIAKTLNILWKNSKILTLCTLYLQEEQFYSQIKKKQLYEAHYNTIAQ